MSQQKKNLIDAINQAISEGHGWHVPPELQGNGFFGPVLLPKESEIDILKKKLEIAEKALKFIAAGEEEGHGPLEGCWAAQDALSKLSELDGE